MNNSRSVDTKAKKKRNSKKLTINTTIIHNQSAKILKTLAISSSKSINRSTSKFILTNHSSPKSSRIMKITPRNLNSSQKSSKFLNGAFLTSVKFKKTSNYTNPFFKQDKSKTFRSPTVNSEMRKNEIYFHTSKSKLKVEQFNDQRMKQERLSSQNLSKMVKKHHNYERDSSMPYIRNISFINSKSSKKKRPSKEKLKANLSFDEIKNFNLDNFSELNAPLPYNFEDIGELLKTKHIPILEDKTLDFMEGLKMEHKVKKRLEKVVIDFALEQENTIEYKEKMMKYTKNFGFKGCSDREDHMKLFSWFTRMKEELTHKFNEEENDLDHQSLNRYIRQFRNILTLFSHEMINIEEQRCKEAALTLKTLYLSNIELFRIITRYFKVCSSELNKRHNEKLSSLTQIKEVLMQGLEFDKKQLRERLENSDNKIDNLKRNMVKLRSKLVNDYTVMKKMRSEIGHLNDMVHVLSKENEKLSGIASDMINEFKINQMFTAVKKESEKQGIIVQVTEHLNDMNKVSKDYSKVKKNIKQNKQISKKMEEKKKGEMTLKELHQFNNKLDISFDEEKSKYEIFKTVEVKLMTDDLECRYNLKQKAIQAAPLGYSDVGLQVKLKGCLDCSNYSKKVEMLERRAQKLIMKNNEKKNTIESLSEKVNNLTMSLETYKNILNDEKSKAKSRNLLESLNSFNFMENDLAADKPVEDSFKMLSDEADSVFTTGSNMFLPSNRAISPPKSKFLSRNNESKLSRSTSKFFKRATSIEKSKAKVGESLAIFMKKCINKFKSKAAGKCQSEEDKKAMVQIEKEVKIYNKMINKRISKISQVGQKGKRRTIYKPVKSKTPKLGIKRLTLQSENLTKKRFNEMNKLSSTIFNNFLKIIETPKKYDEAGFTVLRDVSLWKEISLFYKNYLDYYKMGKKKKIVSFRNFVFRTIRNSNSLKKASIKRYQTVREEYHHITLGPEQHLCLFE